MSIITQSRIAGEPAHSRPGVIMNTIYWVKVAAVHRRHRKADVSVRCDGNLFVRADGVDETGGRSRSSRCTHARNNE